jgi:hypothetical protein
VANYVYLNNVSVNRMLRDDEWEVLDAGQEYEAKNTLPLFWLCMFSEQDITMTKDEVVNGEAMFAYPYLMTVFARAWSLLPTLTGYSAPERLSG